MVFREAPALPCPWCDERTTAGSDACGACEGALAVGGFAIGPVTDRGDGWRVHAARGDTVIQIVDGELAAPWLDRIDAVIAASAEVTGIARVHAAARHGDRLVIARDVPAAGDGLAERDRAPRPVMRALLESCLRILDALHRRGVVVGALEPGAIRFADRRDWAPTIAVGPAVGCFAAPSGEIPTREFVAPELLVSGDAAPSPTTDVYALGAALITARTAKPVAALRRRDGDGLRGSGLQRMDGRVRETLEAMVRQDPDRRCESARAALVLLDTGTLSRAPKSRSKAKPKRPASWTGFGYLAGLVVLGVVIASVIAYEECAGARAGEPCTIESTPSGAEVRVVRTTREGAAYRDTMGTTPLIRSRGEWELRRPDTTALELRHDGRNYRIGWPQDRDGCRVDVILSP